MTASLKKKKHTTKRIKTEKCQTYKATTNIYKNSALPYMKRLLNTKNEEKSSLRKKLSCSLDLFVPVNFKQFYLFSTYIHYCFHHCVNTLYFTLFYLVYTHIYLDPTRRVLRCHSSQTNPSPCVRKQPYCLLTEPLDHMAKWPYYKLKQYSKVAP